MCGRFARTLPVEKIAEIFGAETAGDIPASWNCSPGKDIAVILSEGRFCMIKKSFWGVMPSWGRGRLTNPLINIRSETLLEKRIFERLLSVGRCLIPADGFYEWIKEGKRKRPVFISLPERRLFFMAGLLEREGSEEGCAVITAQAGERLSSFHHRMPLIMDKTLGEAWLTGDGRFLLKEAREPAGLQVWPVSSFVNDPEHDSPLCAAPVQEMR